ncbi:hypothetical protein CWC22_015255 [Pseudoalteromonas rubra]|uniref:Uncharacterized protein n=1 Tax=Pseudoalteromonas rubra TaxID=43658 RepID=A0A5S3UWP8_9GAMM|nr:dockerin type I domain-containing protein [Pseudoalteromonas rubra]QPB84265.1 hypothetical protein CWC22_015255 [Pseudoalteromonas rubra]
MHTHLTSLAKRIKQQVSLPLTKSPSMLLVAALCLPLTALAQTPTQASDPMQLNSTSSSYSKGAAATQLKDDSYIVTWVGSTSNGEYSRIFARHYHMDGTPKGERFIVNSLASANELPGIVSLEDGGYAISWQHSYDDLQGYTRLKSLVKRFNAQSQPVSSEFEVVSDKTLYKTKSELAALTNGGMVVALILGSDSDVYVKLYDADNRSQGSFIRVPLPNYTRTSKVKITELDTGFIVTWLSSSGNRYNIHGQRYNQSGETDGAMLTFAEGLSSINYSTETLSNSDVLISWQELQEDGHIYAKRYNPSAETITEAFVVNTSPIVKKPSSINPSAVQTAPSVTGLENGNYLISWFSDTPNSNGVIYAQMFNAQNEQKGEEFQVFASSSTATSASFVESLNAEKVLIGWTQASAETSNFDIFTQQYQYAGSVAQSLELGMPTGTILEGDTVHLPIKVKGANIYGLDTIINVSDTTKARISGGDYGEFLPSDERLSVPMGISDNQWDGALALMAPATAKSGEGDFATVTLIAEQAGTVNLTLQAQMTDQQGNYLNQSNTDYTLSIEESVTLTGNVADLGIAGDFIYVTLYINGQRVTINPDGSFSVCVGLGEVTMSLSAPGHLTAEKQITLTAGQADIDFGQIPLAGGDSNGDNVIDIADLTQLLGAYRSVDGQHNGYVMAADFNRDGAINLQDLTLLGANFGKQGPQSW